MHDIGRQTAAVLAAHYPADDALLRRAAVIAERLAAVGALPRAPFRELFEKRSLKTLKNFAEGRSTLICTQRV